MKKTPIGIVVVLMGIAITFFLLTNRIPEEMVIHPETVSSTSKIITENGIEIPSECLVDKGWKKSCEDIVREDFGWEGREYDSGAKESFKYIDCDHYFFGSSENTNYCNCRLTKVTYTPPQNPTPNTYIKGGYRDEIIKEKSFHRNPNLRCDEDIVEYLEW